MIDEPTVRLIDWLIDRSCCWCWQTYNKCLVLYASERANERANESSSARWVLWEGESSGGSSGFAADACALCVRARSRRVRSFVVVVVIEPQIELEPIEPSDCQPHFARAKIDPDKLKVIQFARPNLGLRSHTNQFKLHHANRDTHTHIERALI